jgi:TolB protein
MKLSNQLRVCLVALAWLCSNAALAQPVEPREMPASLAPTGVLERSGVEPTACRPTWNTISSRVIGSGLTILNDIAALAPDNIWAAGFQNTNDGRYFQPLVTHWDGTFWTPVPVPTLSPGGRFEALTAIGPSDIWAVGAIQDIDNSQTLTMHWDGAAWSRVDSPNNLPSAYNTLHDVDAAGPNDVWAVGDDGVTALLFHWDGASWKSVAYPSAGQGQSLRGIIALAPNDVWAVGTDSAHPIHWNGTAWSLSSAPIGDAQLFAVDGSSANNIWAAGTRVYQPFVIRWNGTSWSQSDLPALESGNYALTKLAVLSPDDIWAVGRASYSALALHWDGLSWRDVSPVRTLFGDEDLRGVAALSSGNIWAVGTVFMGPGASKTLVRQYAPAIELTDASLAHTSGVATISASLLSTAVQTVTVAYATGDGTAIAGQDYAATSGVLTIPPCQTRASFNVALISNPSWKPSATVNLSLSNPQGALLGRRATLALNVADTTKAPAGRVAFMPALAQSKRVAGVGRIAYVSSRDSNADIWLMNGDGSDRHPLTSNPAREYDPAWSPDGRRLAFVSERDGNAEIYTMNADGSGQTRLTNEPGRDFMPAWSPDGRSIAFVSDRTRVGNASQQLIYVMGADGSRQARLDPIASSEPGDLSPAWSPEGGQIAFSSGREGIREIYVIGPDGSQLHRVTPLSISGSDPAWIENGQRLAFFLPTFGYSNIAMIGVDGTQIRLLNPNFDTHTPFSWSSDGTRVAFSDDYEVSIMTIGEGEPQVLSSSNQNAFEPVFAPQ